MTENNNQYISDASIERFPSHPYLMARLTESALLKVQDICFELKNHPLKKSANSNLAGNLSEQYYLNNEEQKVILSIVSPLADFLFSNSDKDVHTRVTKKSVDIVWQHQSCWANYQKKYEFNPLHNHTGYFSYVLWVDIPYDIEDEFNLPHTKNGTIRSASCFSFHYPDTTGSVRTMDLPLSREDNGLLALFDSRIMHSVNPFYTSDKERISISGNLMPVYSDMPSRPNYKYQ